MLTLTVLFPFLVYFEVVFVDTDFVLLSGGASHFGPITPRTPFHRLNPAAVVVVGLAMEEVREEVKEEVVLTTFAVLFPLPDK
jgi:hypothetical protein